VDTQDDDDDEQKVEVGASSVTNLWLTALNQLQPTTSGVRKASRAGSQTACLIKAGTLLNIWLYFHHGTHA
jgi:hypothetical protein